MFSSMTLLVYSIFIEQPVSGRTQPAGQNGTGLCRMMHSHIASMHDAGHDCGCMVCTSPSICDMSYTSVMVGFPVGAGAVSWAAGQRRSPRSGNGAPAVFFATLAKSKSGSVRAVCAGARAAVQVEGPPAIGKMGAWGELTSTAVSQL